jgi:flagellar secretion chaperone FliS
MSYAAATSAYRDNDVLSASPGRLVVIVYDYLIVSLRRASIALDTNNVELRIESLARSRDALCELLAGLDMEKGGAIATDLSALYSFFIGELIGIGFSYDAKKLARITAQITELRDAFVQITTPATASAA